MLLRAHPKEKTALRKRHLSAVSRGKDTLESFLLLEERSSSDGVVLYRICPGRKENEGGGRGELEEVMLAPGG